MKPDKGNNKRNTFGLITLILWALVLTFLFRSCSSSYASANEVQVDYSTFKEWVQQDKVDRVLMQSGQYVITLKDGVGMDATALDIVSKKVNVTIREMEAAQLPKVLDSVALAVINGNYALGAGLNVSKDAIAFEGADSLAAQTYGNVLVVKEGNEKTAKSEALKKALLSDTVRDFINSNYDGAVVPMF